MEKLKKIAKYTTNTLGVINALLIGLMPIWNIPYADKITATITVIIGVLGGGLIVTKAVSKSTESKG